MIQLCIGDMRMNTETSIWLLVGFAIYLVVKANAIIEEKGNFINQIVFCIFVLLWTLFLMVTIKKVNNQSVLFHLVVSTLTLSCVISLLLHFRRGKEERTLVHASMASAPIVGCMFLVVTYLKKKRDTDVR